jgi:hypothetical protein
MKTYDFSIDQSTLEEINAVHDLSMFNQDGECTKSLWFSTAPSQEEGVHPFSYTLENVVKNYFEGVSFDTNDWNINGTFSLSTNFGNAFTFTFYVNDTSRSLTVNGIERL